MCGTDEINNLTNSANKDLDDGGRLEMKDAGEM